MGNTISNCYDFRFEEEYIRSRLSEWDAFRLADALCVKEHYSEEFLREIWYRFNQSSVFFMRYYKFSTNFLREMKPRMPLLCWREIFNFGNVYTVEEKEKLNKEFGFGLKYDKKKDIWFGFKEDQFPK